jgi:hypothetical protein
METKLNGGNGGEGVLKYYLEIEDAHLAKCTSVYA